LLDAAATLPASELPVGYTLRRTAGRNVIVERVTSAGHGVIIEDVEAKEDIIARDITAGSGEQKKNR
jgi:hypothetical protein